MKMKFPIALVFFTSAMALASPLKEFNTKQDRASVSGSQRDLQEVSITTTKYVDNVGSLVWDSISPTHMILFSNPL